MCNAQISGDSSRGLPQRKSILRVFVCCACMHACVRTWICVFYLCAHTSRRKCRWKIEERLPAAGRLDASSARSNVQVTNSRDEEEEEEEEEERRSRRREEE